MDQQQDEGRNQKIPEINEDKNTTIQNLWDTGKATIRGKFITLQDYLKKSKKKLK